MRTKPGHAGIVGNAYSSFAARNCSYPALVNYVPATYLRLASNELRTDRGTEGLLLERADELSAVDFYPASGPGVTARRNSPRRLAAALHVRVDGARAGRALLVGSSALHRHRLVAGEATFVGLEPGLYQLRLWLPGRGVIRHPVELPDRVAAGLRVNQEGELSR